MRAGLVKPSVTPVEGTETYETFRSIENLGKGIRKPVLGSLISFAEMLNYVVLAVWYLSPTEI